MSFSNKVTKQRRPVNTILVTRQDQNERALVETFIKERFKQVHSAEIVSFMPYLIGLFKETLCASIGMRPATEKLFIEQYLDTPLHDAHPALNIPREEILEVGNLVSCQRHHTLQIFIVMLMAAYRANFKELVFCATHQVATILTRVGAELHPIIDADIRRLGNTLGEWGSYYDHEPVVMRLNIASMFHLIQASPMLFKQSVRFDNDIKALAGELRA